MTKTETKKLSKLAYSKRRGVSHTAVAKAIKTGRLSRAISHDDKGRVLIDAAIADKEWDSNTNEVMRSHGGKPESVLFDEDGIVLTRPELEAAASGTSLAESRALKELYLAKLAQLEYETRSGKLVDAEAVQRVAFNEARRARDMLNTLADRLAPVVAGLTEQFECHAVLTKEIRQVCAALAEQPLAQVERHA